MDKNLDNEISLRVKELMDSHDIKAKELASVLKIRASSLSDILTNKSPWRVKYLLEISKYFKVSLDKLIHGQDLTEKIKEKDEEIRKLKDEVKSLEKIKKFIKNTLNS